MKRKLLKLFLVLFVAAVTTVGVGYGVGGSSFVVLFGIDALHWGARCALEDAPEVVLYSLHPYPFDIKDGKMAPFADDVPTFRGYRVLGQTSLPQGDTREATLHAVNEAVNKVARARGGSVAGCFKPRHGLRATSASGTYDLVICFECGHLHLYLPNGTMKYYFIDGSGAELNRILEAAKVPLPTG